MYYKLQFSNSAAGESDAGKRYVAHTFLIHGLAGDTLAQFLRDNPKSRPDSATGLPMIRSFNSNRHRGEAYAYRSASIDKLTGLTRWRIISSGEIEKRLHIEYAGLTATEAGLNRLERMAMQELREHEYKELFEERVSDQFNGFVQDCIFETDMEVRIPDQYVNQVAERLSLYQAMDSLKDKAELDDFSKQLIDRFGPLPKEVKELLFSFELRWLAESMGLERLVLKSEKLVGHFISNPQSPFYETEQFQGILQNILAKESGYRLAQKDDKLRLVIEPIRHIKDAFEKLQALQIS